MEDAKYYKIKILNNVWQISRLWFATIHHHYLSNSICRRQQHLSHCQVQTKHQYNIMWKKSATL